LVDGNKKIRDTDKNARPDCADSPAPEGQQRYGHSFSPFKERSNEAYRPLSPATQYPALPGAGEQEAAAFSANDHVDHSAKLFAEPADANRRWIITSCVAGVTCSLVIGAVLFGTLRGTSDFASDAGRIWQTTERGNKGDLTIRKPAGNFSANSNLVSAAAYPDNARSRAGLTKTVSYGRAGLNAKIEAEYPDLISQPLPYDHSEESETPGHGYFSSDPSSSSPYTTTVRKAPAPVATFRRVVTLDHGDSLTGILIQNGVSPGHTHRLLRAINPVYPVRRINLGQKIILTLAEQSAYHGGKEIVPLQIAFRPNSEIDQEVVVQLSRDGQYLAHYGGNSGSKIAMPRLKPKTPAGFASSLSNTQERILAKAKIRGSVYKSARLHGIPKHVVARMLGVHSFKVDFQRQVRNGDSFEVFFGKPVNNQKTRRPVLLYSQLTLSGRKTKGYYRFTAPDDGITGYYDETGKSVASTLMRTPVSARISSGFGRRKHPILGYTKMHTGVDFAASYGTPVKAAGSGKVEMARRVGAYGKYIRIKHARGYKTAYAHLSRYARGIKAGAKIRQGQVIGYVGSTGRSTGPHLHYEIFRGDRRINPLSVKTAGGRSLKGRILKKFKLKVARIDALRAGAVQNTKVAASQ
jgi:murein DD-endopeptidase MepM/ murein hydrolase activator NlpD